MRLWNLVFFPPEGEKNSPVDFLKTHCGANELASIMSKLASLQEMDTVNWPFKWAKPVRGLAQMTNGDFRIYHKLNKGTIVVVHACRKVRNEAKESDIRNS